MCIASLTSLQHQLSHRAVCCLSHPFQGCLVTMAGENVSFCVVADAWYQYLFKICSERAGENHRFSVTGRVFFHAGKKECTDSFSTFPAFGSYLICSLVLNGSSTDIGNAISQEVTGH